MRIRTLFVATFTLPLAACVSCGSDSPPACKDVAACTAKPTLVAGGIACGQYSPCPVTRPACTKPVVPSAGLQEIDLGSHTVGDVISFDVPSGTSSITIVEEADGATAASIPPATVSFRTPSGSVVTVDNTAVPDKLKNPGGTTIFDDTSSPPADPSGVTVFFASNSPVTGAFTVPNTSRLLSDSVNGLPTGKWQFVVNDFAYECANATNCTGGGSSSTTYQVHVVLKGGAPHPSGTVDLAFYLVGSKAAGGILPAAKDAPSDPGIARMVSSIASLYAKSGICLGTVTFYDIPSWAEVAYGGNLDVRDTSPCSDLNQMFTLSVPGNQLNFFLVNALVADPQGSQHVVGIDGTIPGPSAFGGTIHSGAAVSGESLEKGICGAASVNPLGCGADLVAYIAAHEGGHWLGLYHTTESLGDGFDPLADTAKCPCDPCVPAADRKQCTNPDPTLPSPVTGANCTKSTACGGGENLMFWLLDDTSTGALTCEQGAVMRANPVVH